MGRTRTSIWNIPTTILCLCLSVNIDLIKKPPFLYSNDLFLKYSGMFGDSDSAAADNDANENNNQNYSATTSLVICQTHFKISGLAIHSRDPSFIAFARSLFLRPSPSSSWFLCLSWGKDINILTLIKFRSYQIHISITVRGIFTQRFNWDFDKISKICTALYAKQGIVYS